MHAQTFSPRQRPKLAEGYTRYAVPSQCVAAVHRETQEVRRGATFLDTMAYTAVLAHDLIPSSALRAAQQCVTHVETAALPSTDHIAMVELALYAQRENISTRFLDSVLVRLAGERESDSRVWLAERLIRAYPGGDWKMFTPLRYPQSLAKLLSLVSCTDGTLCFTKSQMLHMLRRDARGRGDFASAATYADSLVALERQRQRLPETLREAEGRLHVYPRTDFFVSLARRYDDVTLVTGSASAQPAWERVREGVKEVGDNPDNPFVEWEPGNRYYLFMDSLFRLGTPVTFPALTPNAWIGPNGIASAPAPGRVVLIINKAQMLDYYFPWEKFPTVTAMLRRLHTRYAASGFDIVWVIQSRGHFKGSSVLSFDEEQKALAAYWFDHHKVPGVIALDQTSFGKRPDNRLVPLSSSTGVTAALSLLSARSAGIGVGQGGIYLMDRKGNLSTPATSIDKTRDAEIALARMIERALSDPVK